MKKTFTAYCIVSIVILATACQRVMEKDCTPEKPGGDYTLTALLEGGEDTKTHLSEADAQGIYYPFWSKGDALALYADGINRPDTYTLVQGEGTIKGSFTGKLFGSRMVALYPASGRTEEGLRGEVLTLNLPAQQEYMPGSFGKDTYPMLAVTTSGELSFKNLCSVLKLSLTGEEYIRSITFRAADSKMAVSGKATVRTDFSSVPELVMAQGGSNEVTLKCGSVELSASQPTEFFIVIPAGTYRGGFAVEIETYHGTVTRSTSADIAFERSQFRSIPTFVCEGTGEIDPDQIPYNQIWYKTFDEQKYDFHLYPEDFDANIVSNTYENGMGVLVFDTPVKVVGDFAFGRSWGNFTDVRLPDSVERIGYGAFTGCLFSSFRVPDGLMFMGGSAFHGCEQLSRFYGKWATEDGCFVVLEDGNLVAFAPAALEETLRIPEGVRSLSSDLFYDNDLLRHIILPEGLINVGEYCFYRCESLESVSIPSTLEKLGNYSFTYCPNLRELRGSDMGKMTISDDGRCLVDQDGVLRVFAGKGITDFIIPKGVTKLGDSAMNGWPELRSLTFPTTIIGGWTDTLGGPVPFDGCDKLEFFYGYGATKDHYSLVYNNCLYAVSPACPSEYSVPADEGITHLYYTFYRHPNLEKLVLPDCITFLGDYRTFSYMPKLRSLTLPALIDFIPYLAFEEDYALEELYIRSIIPPSFDTEYYTYQWGSESLVIYVPKGFEDLYKQSSGWSKYADRIQGYVYDDLPPLDYYMSSDYSLDGEVSTLQKASKGQGINLVLMGDAYSDQQIEDGTYSAAMRQMMEAFFSEEPYTSYRDLFNVYSVAVVSATEGYDHAGQALGTWFGDGTQVGGNDARCMEYARKVVPESEMDNTVIIVAMNRDYYAGTCYMYHPFDGDYGNGLSVAYFPTSSDTDTFGALVLHEAGGHGFPKLGDEYAYEGSIPQEKKEGYKALFPYGWWKNIDFTSDPDQVKWARFLKDSRYSNDGLGVFEGGATYAYGVWRPTENSIMRHNTGGFNAPSREAIWYRMHKLAYGNNWNYDYEEFVAYDAKNRAGSAAHSPARSPNYVERRREPTHPPVVMGRRWNDPIPRKQEASRRDEPLNCVAPDKLPRQVKTTR